MWTPRCAWPGPLFLLYSCDVATVAHPLSSLEPRACLPLPPTLVAHLPLQADAQQLLYMLAACLVGLANSLPMGGTLLLRWAVSGAAFAVPCALANARPTWCELRWLRIPEALFLTAAAHPRGCRTCTPLRLQHIRMFAGRLTASDCG